MSCSECPNKSRRDYIRTLAIKNTIRFKIFKERKKKLFQRDTELMEGYECILTSPEMIEYIKLEMNEGFNKIETEIESSAFGDGSLLEKLMQYLFEEDGFQKILEFILALIKAFI